VRPAQQITLNSEDSSLQPKLEHIQVPTFDGDILKFQNFKSLFENLIHNNAALSNVQKLYYLKQALISSAGKLVRNFELSKDSYTEAWEFVLARYGNKRATIWAVFKRLQNLESINSNVKIRSLLDQVDIVIHGLKAVSEKIDTSF